MAHQMDRRSMSQDMVVSVVFMAEHVTVKVVFTHNMKVSDAIKAVGEKCGNIKLLYPFSNYGLFLPPSENTGGVWLHYEDPINYYHIESKGVLEFKIKPIPLKIVIPDIKNKECTMVIDTTLPVSTVISTIKLKMRLPEPGALNCYRLNILDSDEILHESITLQAQGVNENTTLELLRWPKKKRKFAKKLTDKRDRISRLDKGGGVYGIPVGDVIARTGEKIVPLVVALTRSLEFRGFEHASFNAVVNESDLRLARMAVNSGDPYAAVEDIKDSNMLAALLKDYFKDLPDPLVQAQARGVLARLVAEIQPIQLRFISVICCGLNEGHLYLLQHMLHFFKKILDNPKNRIDKTSLLNVWGPILLRAEHEIENGECIISTALLFNYYTYIDTLKPTPPEFVGLAQAMYPFHSDNDQEISFKAGEYIFVSNQDESGWWSGDMLNGARGLFPSNYVELLLLFQSGDYDDDFREKEEAPVRSSMMTDYDDDEIEDITTSNRTSFHLPSSYPTFGTRVTSPVQGQSPTPSTSTSAPSQTINPAALKKQPSSGLQEVNGHNSALQQELDRAKSEIVSLKQQLESERTQHKKETTNVSDLKKEVQKLKDENAKLHDTISKLQSDAEHAKQARPTPPSVPPPSYPPSQPPVESTPSHRPLSPPVQAPTPVHATATTTSQPPAKPAPVRPPPVHDFGYKNSPQLGRPASPPKEEEENKPEDDKLFKPGKVSLFARQAARNSANILDKQHLISPASPTPVRNAPITSPASPVPPASPSSAHGTPHKEEHAEQATPELGRPKPVRPPPPVSKLPSSTSLHATTAPTPIPAKTDSLKSFARPQNTAHRVSTTVNQEEAAAIPPPESKPIPIRPPPNPKPNGFPTPTKAEPEATEEKSPLRPSQFASNRASTKVEPSAAPKEEVTSPITETKTATPERKFVRPPLPASHKPSAPSPVTTTSASSSPVTTSTSPPQEPSPIASPSPPKIAETVGSTAPASFNAKKPPPPRSFGRPPLKVAADEQPRDSSVASPPPSPAATTSSALSPTSSSNPPLRPPPAKPVAKKPAPISPPTTSPAPLASPGSRPTSPLASPTSATSPTSPSATPISPSAFQPKRPPPPMKSPSQFQSPPFPFANSPTSPPPSAPSPSAATTEEPPKPVLKKHPFAIRK